MLNHSKKIISVSLFLLGFILLALTYNNNNPYKSGRTLPEIKVDEVTQVTVEYFVSDDHKGSYEGEVGQLVHWFNKAKELKSDVGTTSDSGSTPPRETDGYRDHGLRVGFHQGSGRNHDADQAR